MLEAADTTEAVHACREVSEPVDLSIIDIKNGTQLARRLARQYPQMVVLFIGDSEKMRGQQPQRLKYEYLQKPFTAGALLKSIRDLIQSGVGA